MKRNRLHGGAVLTWTHSAAVSISVLALAGLVTLIAIRGLHHFWPVAVDEVRYSTADGGELLLYGQVREREYVPASRLGEGVPGADRLADGAGTWRTLLKTGNRDLAGSDFRWIYDTGVTARAQPEGLAVLERREWGVFIGRLLRFDTTDRSRGGDEAWSAFRDSLARSRELRKEIDALETDGIGKINYRLERLRVAERRLDLDPGAADETLRREELRQERALLQDEYRRIEQELTVLYRALDRDSVVMETSDGQQTEVRLAAIVDAWRPNTMGLVDKTGHFLRKLGQFLSEEPREANMEGGVFPAIYGTILMVFLMTVVVAPFGVMAAVYLHEYAGQNTFTRLVRITVSNMAGVPSIVYGVFGLGFFVYTLGGGIDRLFFDATLPAPTFGTGGLFWASLTMAMLTLPVVIVSTEEGLTRIPRNIREGSLALGATQWETLRRTVLPMASPGIITGLILAVARAAGEVAPLMLVGVVKLAPSLPLDGNFPYLHLERKFMHLGFHIYDVGFQSPNVEAARPLVFATALLLIVVAVSLNLVAFYVRNSLRSKYRGLET
jgi:phosphate transport system permease protein